MSDPITRLNAALEGRYTIARSLGEGGMAHVFLAADHRHDRPVAIKVLKPEIAATIGAERFLTEIKTSANLQHPHILPVHDSGEADGLLYFVVPFPRTADARWAVSTGGGRSPRWSPAGGEIFFIDATDNMVSVPVETGPTFTFGPARVLFPVGGYAVETFYHAPYDVTADGQRFLMLEPVGSGENQLVAVQGFFEVLEGEARR